LLTALGASASAKDAPAARDPKQPIDEEYTRRSAIYHAPFFASPLVRLPACLQRVPTPKAVLGTWRERPAFCPYSQQVYTYFKMLEKRRLE